MTVVRFLSVKENVLHMLMGLFTYVALTISHSAETCHKHQILASLIRQ